jgi:hypothetical protein
VNVTSVNALVSLYRQQDRMRRTKFPPIGHAALKLGRVKLSVSASFLVTVLLLSEERKK